MPRSARRRKARPPLPSRSTYLERELKRTARELHDQVLQDLSTILWDLHALAERPPRTKTEVRQQAKLLEARLSQQTTTIRELSHSLHPRVLYYPDLEEELAKLVKSYQARSGVRHVLIVSGRPEILPKSVGHALYRVLQECLTNVTRHAKARNCQVALHVLRHHVRLEVMDDGTGFSPRKRKKGIGLLNMQERIAEMHGRVRVSSKPSRGTKVRVTIPLPSR